MPQLLRDRTAPTINDTNGVAPEPASDVTPTVVVEARTAAEALEQVHRVHGEGARIIQAEKVLKGGVGGFFAKELVQLTVDPTSLAGTAAPAAPMTSAAMPPPVAAATDPHADETFGELLDRRTGTSGSGRGLSSVVAELAAATDNRESTFGDALRAAIDSPAHSPTPAERAALTSETVAAVRQRDPRLSTGATALADIAQRVELPVEVTPPAAEPMEQSEARLDAAVRAVSAGTMATAVMRAAESGGATGFAPLDLAAAGEEAIPAAVDPAPVMTPVATPAPAAPAAVAPLGAVPAGVWSEENLARLGVPDVLIRAVVGQLPTDDLSWFTAVARAVEPLCRPLPEGAAMLVGGRSGRLAKAIDATTSTLDQRAPRRGSVAITCKPTDRARAWMDRERRGRWTHLVAGGNGWRDWLWDGPAAISWTDAEDLPTALGAAAQLDLALGGVVRDGTYVEASPVDVAMGLRLLLDVA